MADLENAVPSSNVTKPSDFLFAYDILKHYSRDVEFVVSF